MHVDLVSYEYELRENEDIVATGRLTLDQPLAIGDRVVIGRRMCTVIDFMPALSGREGRLILGLVPGTSVPGTGLSS